MMGVSTNSTSGVKKSPHLFAYSFNHHQADMEVRELLKLDAKARETLVDRFRAIPGLESYVVLDTCNRWEIYGVASEEAVLDDIWVCIEAVFPLNMAQLKSIVCEFRESQMIQHLFEVCAGMDSQMVGETEILGQVKAAYSEADENSQIDMVLHRVFSKAFQAAKWVRTHTLIGKGQVSIGNVSVDLASRIFGNLKECKVLLIGSGEVGRLTAQALKNRDTESVTFVSRTFSNALSLADEIGGDVIPWNQLYEVLHRFDIVVSSTSAPHVILDKKRAKVMMRQRSYRPLFIIDLAMPRDIEPVVGKISQVFLYNLDDVSEIANENLESRSQEIETYRHTISAKAWVTWLEVVRRQRMRLMREKMK